MSNMLYRILATVLILASGSAFSSPSPSGTRTVNIAFISGPGQAEHIRNTISNFSEETGIQATFTIRNDTDYKALLPGWVIEGKDSPDVLYWVSSYRLNYYADRKAILPITDFWNKEQLDSSFSMVKKAVQHNGQIWGLPISRYHFGIYYNKALIAKYGKPPTKWKDMLAMAARMKADGISPFGLANKEKWPAAVWFDYLDLRINGLAFHQKLLSGEVAFTDSRVLAVLNELKKIIDLKYFDQQLLPADRGEVISLLARGKLGFVLISNGITTRINAENLAETGFMPFPEIVPGNNYEESPVNVLMLSRYATHVPEAYAFLKFMAQAKNQVVFNAGLGYLPANQNSKPAGGSFIAEGIAMLNNAKGFSQYFDRDTTFEFQEIAIPLIADFMYTGDVAKVSSALEQARKTVFPAK